MVGSDSRRTGYVASFLMILVVSSLCSAPTLAQDSRIYDRASLRLGFAGARHYGDMWDQKLNTSPWRLGGLGFFPTGKAEIRLREETERLAGVTAGFTAFYFSEWGGSDDPELHIGYLGPSLGASKDLTDHFGLYADIGLGFRRMSFHSFLGDDLRWDLAHCLTIGVAFFGKGPFVMRFGFFGCGPFGSGTDYIGGPCIELGLLGWRKS